MDVGVCVGEGLAARLLYYFTIQYTEYWIYGQNFYKVIHLHIIQAHVPLCHHLEQHIYLLLLRNLFLQHFVAEKTGSHTHVKTIEPDFVGLASVSDADFVVC
jgi:hypothetical protein